MATPLACFLKKLRESRDVAQKELALSMGLRQGIVSAWECGRKKPTESQRSRLIEILDLTDQELQAWAVADRQSRRTFTVSEQAVADEYVVWDLFAQYSGKIPPEQLQIMRLAIETSIPAEDKPGRFRRMRTGGLAM